MPFPRYTTFGDEELVAAFKDSAPSGHPTPDACELRRQGNASPGRRGTAATNREDPNRPGLSGGRPLLLKEHHCPVAYPDGADGTCRYVRIGPDWHLFQYRHHGYETPSGHAILRGDSGNAGKPEGGPPPSPASERFLTGAALPVQRFGERMGNTPGAIEEKAQVLAASAFSEAIRHEQHDRFRRATPPAFRKPDPTAFQFTAKRAKEIGGKYALCRRVGDKLLPDSPLFDTLDEANAAWRERGDSGLLVACACRWTRRWELPRFNPLYGPFPVLRPEASAGSPF